MILVDANIWIDHLRHHDPLLDDLILSGEVRLHPYTIAEIGLGSLANRDFVIDQLERLSAAPVAQHHEVMTLITRNQIAGTGIGYVDCHLLASAILYEGKLWTRDKRLEAIATLLGVSHAPN